MKLTAVFHEGTGRLCSVCRGAQRFRHALAKQGVVVVPGADTQGDTSGKARENLNGAVSLIPEANREMAEEALRGTSLIRETFVLPLA
jgi:hypothetical protein